MNLRLDLNSMPGMADPRLKMGWANHHLKSLEGELGRFSQSNPYTFSTEDDLEAGQHILHLFFEGVPATVGLIFGDFISCLRSSLDHLAYQLTRLPGGLINDRTLFPVIESNNSSGRRQFDSAICGVPQPAVAIIESLQPYHSGDLFKTTKLWQLHKLWNIDKHRKIPYRFAGIEIKVAHPAEVAPITCGTNYGGVMRFPLADKMHVNLQPSVEFSIEFGDEAEGVVVNMSELIGIHKFVRDEVLARFDHFFQQP